MARDRQRPKNKKKASGVLRDPYAEREARKYENPIPSREALMAYLQDCGMPLSQSRMAEELGLASEDQQEALRRRLNAMTRDGQLVRNRRGAFVVVNREDLIRGRVIGHPDGYGFLVPDEGGDDLFLSPGEMRSLLHGDRVVARVSGIDRRGRKEGAVVEVVERGTSRVVGRFMEEESVAFLVPQNRRITQDIIVPQDARGDAQHGDIAVVELVRQPGRHAVPLGRVVEVLGEHMAPGMETEVAIRAHELPLEWPEGVLDEVADLEETVPESAKQGLVDLRDVPLVTIDDITARDFDDAVYCERKPKGWRLLVAIADVSHYVQPDSALDREACLRGNSVYFPDRVLPMLPEVLSNGLCSLNPDVDRLCMVCEMYVDRDGQVYRSRFFEAVMRSAARLTYTDVAAMLVDRDPELRARHKPLLGHLEDLYDLYRVLRAARERRGAIDFDTTETRIVFSEERKIERIEPVVRNDAHKLIEECMILANVTTAKYLSKRRIPTVYRVHERPKAEKVQDVRAFLGELGLELGGGDDPGPKDYTRLLEKVRGRPDAHLIETVLLRSLNQAQYSPDNVGHFGLAQDHYLHFTSPIRRYPDLLVHRAIRHVLAGGKGSDFQYDHNDLVTLGEHCSMTERRADEATRDVAAWLKCEYMSHRVGDVFDGIITGVTSFGIFVELQDVYVEGLVHITALGNDYYHFDAVQHRLVGDRTGTTYRLGDSVRVQVVRVDMDARKIDFELAETDADDAPPGKARKKRRGRRRGGARKSAQTAQE